MVVCCFPKPFTISVEHSSITIRPSLSSGLGTVLSEILGVHFNVFECLSDFLQCKCNIIGKVSVTPIVCPRNVQSMKFLAVNWSNGCEETKVKGVAGCLSMTER